MTCSCFCHEPDAAKPFPGHPDGCPCEPGRTTSSDEAFRSALLDALHSPLHELGVRIPGLVNHPGDHCNVVAAVALDALLPVLSDWIKPHRWDKDYPESAAPGPCHGSAPDTFYAGVLHAAAVVRDLLPPKPRGETDA